MNANIARSFICIFFVNFLFSFRFLPDASNASPYLLFRYVCILSHIIAVIHTVGLHLILRRLAHAELIDCHILDMLHIYARHNAVVIGIILQDRSIQ